MKILDWLLSKTKIGAAFDKVQEFLSGKKAYLAGIAMMVPALCKIIQDVADQGLPAILHITGTPEYKMFLEGIAICAGRAAIAKTVPA